MRRHKGVVWVKQLVQVVGALPSPCLVPPGLWGRDGAAELKPDSGGELGEDCGRPCIPACTIPAALGVELVRGIFWRRGSFPRLRISLTEAAEPCVRPRLPPELQWSCGEDTISAPPMVTVLRGGPAGYRACIGLNWLERLVSHWKPAVKSILPSSMGE